MVPPSSSLSSLSSLSSSSLLGVPGTGLLAAVDDSSKSRPRVERVRVVVDSVSETSYAQVKTDKHNVTALSSPSQAPTYRFILVFGRRSFASPPFATPAASCGALAPFATPTSTVMYSASPTPAYAAYLEGGPSVSSVSSSAPGLAAWEVLALGTSA